ncbi:MAG: hypothetical protein QM635_08970 [Microbacteriaceae bacterium]
MTQLTTDAAALESEFDDGFELTALDRCDSCGAQAYIRVTLPTGELLFCAHHGTEFKGKLAPRALHWHDETAKLLAERAR